MEAFDLLLESFFFALNSFLVWEIDVRPTKPIPNCIPGKYLLARRRNARNFYAASQSTGGIDHM